MKKLLIILMIISVNGFAQITLEQTYPIANSSGDYLKLIKLSSSGYKYVAHDTSSIYLYNLNHTVFRTISIPHSPGELNWGQFFTMYISEELFNTNPADIEYLLYYNHGTPHCKVYEESGNVLFSLDSIYANQAQDIGYGNENFISYSPSGYKMILLNMNLGNQVYSLPGFLPCQDCSNSVVTSIRTDNNINKEGNISNYPNPNSGETTIAYTLPQGTTIADLVIYSITGQELKRYKVTSAFHDILISTTDLEAGTYYYQIQTTTGFSAGKKMIVIK